MNYFAELRKDMAEFTGLTLEKIYAIADKKEVKGHTEQFNFFAPKTRSELEWFYMSNNAYLFAFLRRKPGDAVRKIFREYVGSGKRPIILDFGGGIANDLFSLYEINSEFFPIFVELNILQLEFVKWRSQKYNTKIMAISGREFIDKIGFMSPDILILMDIVEHLYDYPSTLKPILDRMPKFSHIIEHTPFGTNDFDIHMKDKYGFQDFLNKNGFNKLEEHIWRKR